MQPRSQVPQLRPNATKYINIKNSVLISSVVISIDTTHKQKLIV